MTATTAAMSLSPLAATLTDKDVRTHGKQADARAHEALRMGMWSSLRRNYKACLWSAGLTLAIIMEGYDIQLIASFFGQAAFVDKFGERDPATGKKFISAPWQSGLSNAALCGEILGLLINGALLERVGHRRLMIAALVWLIGAVFTPVFAPSLPVLCVGAVLQGIPWGVFQTLTTAYAVEICPQAVRHYLTTFVDVCWIAGAALASGVLRGALRIDGNWGYRLPYALQWTFPVPLLMVALFCPDSPWWLVRRGRTEDARRALQRLSVKPYETEEMIEDTLAMIVHTTALEKAHTRGGWPDCFRPGPNLRRTQIVCLVWSLQWWCGYGLVTYATTFFQRAGLSATQSFNLNIIMQAVRIFGPFIAWFAMDRYGRRTIYLNGALVCCATMAVIGGLGFGDARDPAYGKAIGSILVVFAFYYSSTIGPLCYTIVSEIPSGPLRAKQIVLARTTYNLIGFLTNAITPRMISTTAWDWGARGALFYMGTGALAGAWLWFCLPETRNRSFGEIEMLFQRRVSAGQFAKTEVDQFGGEDAAAAQARGQIVHCSTDIINDDDDIKDDKQQHRQATSTIITTHDAT